jgi:hypothetical protein
MKKHLRLYSLLCAIGLTVVAGFVLRYDHQRMIELREAVLEDDSNADEVALAEDLTLLREFVLGHPVINFEEDARTGRLRLFWGTGSFYLQGSYNRAVLAANEAAGATDEEFMAPELPDPALYHLGYVSPILSWSPASWLILLGFCAYAVFFTTVISSGIKLLLNKKSTFLRKTLDR